MKLYSMFDSRIGSYSNVTPCRSHVDIVRSVFASVSGEIPPNDYSRFPQDFQIVEIGEQLDGGKFTLIPFDDRPRFDLMPLLAHYSSQARMKGEPHDTQNGLAEPVQKC